MSLIPIALFWMSLDYFLSQYGFDYISSLRERSREDSCLWKVFSMILLLIVWRRRLEDSFSLTQDLLTVGITILIMELVLYWYTRLSGRMSLVDDTIFLMAFGNGGMSYRSVVICFTIYLVQTINLMRGYRFAKVPFIMSALEHHIYWETWRYNFGRCLTVWDQVFGTYKSEERYIREYQERLSQLRSRPGNEDQVHKLENVGIMCDIEIPRISWMRTCLRVCLLPVPFVLATVEREIMCVLTRRKVYGYRGLFGAIYCTLNILTADVFSFFLLMRNLYIDPEGDHRPVIEFYIFSRKCILVTSARHVQRMYSDPKISVLPPPPFKWKDLLGFSVVTVDSYEEEGYVRKHTRNRVMYTLNGRFLSLFAKKMERIFEEDILPRIREYLRGSSICPISEFLTRYACLSVYGSFLALTSSSVSPDQVQVLPDLFSQIRQRVMETISIPLSVPPFKAANIKWQVDLKKVKDLLRELIPHHKNQDTVFGFIVRAHTRYPAISPQRLTEWLVRSKCVDLEPDVILRIIEEVVRRYSSSSSKVKEVYWIVTDMINELAFDLGISGDSKACGELKERLQYRLESEICADGEIDIEKVVEEQTTYLLAGSDTTIANMCWSVALLSRRPYLQEKLYEVISSRTQEEVLNSPYVGGFVKEILRLGHPVFFSLRYVVSDTIVDTCPVSAGTIVFSSQHMLHTDPLYWSYPQSIISERWLNSSYLEPGSYYRFSLGKRICPGMDFAMTETRLAIVGLEKNFMLEGLNLDPIPSSAQFTFRPLKPTVIKMISRET